MISKLYVYMICSFVMLLGGCFYENNEPSLFSMSKPLKERGKDFNRMAEIMQQSGLVRVAYNSVFPIDLAHIPEVNDIRLLMNDLDVGTGVQYHIEDDYFEVLYWSSGILSRGSSIVFIKSYNSLSLIPYLKEIIDNGLMECSVINYVWSICKKYG
ncbi:hypothetical protein [Microbulbifer pacificus]|uniref:hypothetical protein n=1 Tax=Microbulbifer pacificus TaxID=407164 RepID=UPI000CF406C9|nr:hypothetical protein [Microbulbifer pacificus]